MTKKYLLTAATLIAALSLTACGGQSKTDKKGNEGQTVTTETAKLPEINDKEKASEDATVFTGVLREDAKEAGSAIILNIGDAVGVEDKADIVKMFSESGVIINAEENQLGKDEKLTDYLKGQKVEVKLVGTAPMSRSLPPQIPGNAVISIKKIK